MAAIQEMNLPPYFFVLLLLSGAGYLQSLTSDQLHALVMLFLNAHKYVALKGFGTILFPSYKHLLDSIALLGFIEIVFPLWLLIKGVKKPQPATEYTYTRVATK